MSEERSAPVDDLDLGDMEDDRVDEDESPQGESQESGADAEPERVAEEQAGLDDAQELADEAPEPGSQQRRRQAPLGRRSASDRFQELANRNRDLQERLDRIERDRTQGQTAEQQRVQAERLAQQEAEFFLTATPQQSAAYLEQKIRGHVQQEIQQTRFQLWDTSDQQAYDRLVEENGRLGRFADRVQELHRDYPTVSRIDLLDKAIGEAMRRGLKPASARQQNRAQDAAARHTTRAPANSRGNVGGERQRSGARRNGFEHMRNVLI